MKIEFEKIIEKANARKLALENLMSLLGESADRADQMDDVIKYAATLRHAFEALDVEGKALLPQNLQTALNFIDVPNLRYHYFGDVSGGRYVGVKAIAIAFQAGS